MEKLVLLRGVTPTGKNRIPKMAYLAEILENAGFSQVRTYIQSGNILLETERDDGEIRRIVHQEILEKIGADLSVIVKDKGQLQTALRENPFDESYDESRIHLVFTNDQMVQEKLQKVMDTEFEDELFREGSECLYLYLPREAKKKRLNTNYLEKKLGITATMRKRNVIAHLCQWQRSGG